MKILKAARFAELHENAADMIRLRVEKEATEARYKEAVQDTVEAVVKVLHDNPGAVMTCGDIASATGLSTAAIARSMGDHPAIRVSRQPIQRTFIELDEDGQPIPGAYKTEEYNRTTYEYVGRRSYLRDDTDMDW